MGKHKLLSPSQQILSPKFKQVAREEICDYKKTTQESQNWNEDTHKFKSQRNSKKSVFPLTYCLTVADGKPKISIVRNSGDTPVSISSLYPNKDESNLADAVQKSDECKTKETPVRAKVLDRKRYCSSSTKSYGKLSAVHLSRKRDSENQGLETESLLKSMEKDLREIEEFRKRQVALHSRDSKMDQKRTAVHDLELVTSKKFRIKES